MNTEPLQRAVSAFLMALGAEIPQADRSRIRGRATYMAACLEQSGQHDAALICRDFATAIDTLPITG